MTEIQEGSKVARLSAIVRLTTFADNSPHVTYPDPLPLPYPRNNREG